MPILLYLYFYIYVPILLYLYLYTFTSIPIHTYSDFPSLLKNVKVSPSLEPIFPPHPKVKATWHTRESRRKYLMQVSNYFFINCKTSQKLKIKFSRVVVVAVVVIKAFRHKRIAHNKFQQLTSCKNSAMTLWLYVWFSFVCMCVRVRPCVGV